MFGASETGVEQRDRPVRVCMVGPSTDILGGQAVQAERLLTRLREMPGVEISFLPINPRMPGVLRRLQRIKYVRTLVTEAAYVGALAACLRGYDVVHVFSASYFSFVLAPTPAILLAKMYGKKVVLNYRSGEAEDHLQRWRTAVPTIRLADEVVVPSGYLVDVFAKFGVRARSIFNIVDFERFRFRERRPLRPVFLANRNLEPLYDVATVLRAFALIQQQLPDARLTIAGDGSERAALERLAAELGLRNSEFVGRIAPEEMSRWYDQADVYLNSSVIDNMPGSIIEAFASGLPVVTTDAGGIPYIVEQDRTGLLVPRGDHRALAQSALRLFHEPDLAAGIIARAREECQTHYSWEAVGDEWVRLYRHLAGQPTSQRARAHPEARSVLDA